MTPKRFLRAVLRRLGDREGWRTAGIAEYASAQSWLRVQGGGLALRLAVGGLALMMVPLCIGVLFSSARPETTGAMIVFLISSSGSAVLGVWWLRLRQPRSRDAILFVAVADVCLFAGCLAQSGLARISGTTYLGMLAMLTAFLLGWRILLLHCLLSVAAVLATTITTMIVDGYTVGELYATLAPALAMVFALPMMVQFVVEFGRRGISAIVTGLNRDELTGLYNRIGFQTGVRTLASRGRSGGVVAVVDLDGFKQYNDTHGHLAGDQRLVEVGRMLRLGLPSTLVARMGGDEFLVAALRSTREESDLVIDRLRNLVSESRPGPTIGGSAGVVVTDHLVGAELSRIVSEADNALYEAKADRSRRIVVHERHDDAPR